MLLLTSTSDLLRVTTSASASVDCHASWMDYTAPSTVTPGRTNTTPITTATTTTVVGSPASSVIRNVKELHVRNKHASTSCDVTVIHTDGTTVAELYDATLLAGESLHYSEGRGFYITDTNGAVKPADAPKLDGGASTAAQGPGFSSDTYVTGSAFPVTGRLQAGSFLRWRISMSKTAAGTAAPTYNIRYGTAGAVGDTSRVLFTGPAQSGVADTAILEITAQFRAVGASAIIQGELELHHNLAVTGFATVNPAGLVILSTTSSAFDSTPTGSIIGISMNGGASAAWTVTSVLVGAVNIL